MKSSLNSVIVYFKRGVKNGMFMGPARQLCPDLLTIPYDFEGYSQVSHQLYDLVSRCGIFVYTYVGACKIMIQFMLPDFKLYVRCDNSLKYLLEE